MEGSRWEIDRPRRVSRMSAQQVRRDTEIMYHQPLHVHQQPDKISMYRIVDVV